jgi:ATP-dependent HslUV protease ATP-binding subunit HslU
MKISSEDLRKAITPSNILLVGPTGSGKTEVARRLARKVEAPFVKVVATKYSEVGFVGEDTSSMIEELAEQAYQDEVASLKQQVHYEARLAAIEEVTNAFMSTKLAVKEGLTREMARSMVEGGLVDDVEIEMEASLLEYAISKEKESTVSYANDEVSDLPIINARSILSSRPFSRGNATHRAVPTRQPWRVVTVSHALKTMTDRGSTLLTKSREPELKERAKRAAEERGIVFIDEFDKMISGSGEEASSFNQVCKHTILKKSSVETTRSREGTSNIDRRNGCADQKTRTDIY